jgi:HrpA-like RNA helicase
MLEQRKQLPAWGERERILQVLEKSQVVVISGMTGCGKRSVFAFLLLL